MIPMQLENAGPSFIGATLIEVLFPKKLDGGTMFVSITGVTTDAGDTCATSTRQSNVSTLQTLYKISYTLKIVGPKKKKKEPNF